jgi:hypothetical protein
MKIVKDFSGFINEKNIEGSKLAKMGFNPQQVKFIESNETLYDFVLQMKLKPEQITDVQNESCKIKIDTSRGLFGMRNEGNIGIYFEFSENWYQLQITRQYKDINFFTKVFGDDPRQFMDRKTGKKILEWDQMKSDSGCVPVKGSKVEAKSNEIRNDLEKLVERTGSKEDFSSQRSGMVFQMGEDGTMRYSPTISCNNLTTQQFISLIKVLDKY